MTITPRVQRQMFQSAPTANARLIRIPQTRPGAAPSHSAKSNTPHRALAGSPVGASWTPQEHERFLEGLELFPSGPWRRVVEYIETKSARQTMTHAQKYRQKIARRLRGSQTIVRDDTTGHRSSRSVRIELRSSDQESDDGMEFDLQSESGSVSDLEFATFMTDLNLAAESMDSESMSHDSASSSSSTRSSIEFTGDDTRNLFQELLDDVNDLADQQLLLDSAALLHDEPCFSNCPGYDFVSALVPSEIPSQFDTPCHLPFLLEELSPKWSDATSVQSRGRHFLG